MWLSIWASTRDPKDSNHYTSRRVALYQIREGETLKIKLGKEEVEVNRP